MLRTFLKYVAFGLYALAGLMVAFFNVPQTGWKALSVQTGSMTPAIQQGSLVLIHKQELSNIKQSDVVTFRNPGDPSQTITHRVIEVGNDNGVRMFTTKGDANKAADPEIPGGTVIGKVAASIPFAGTLVNWLKTPLGLILFVGLPGLIIIGYEFRLMLRRIQHISAEEARQEMQPTAIAQPPEAKRAAPIKKQPPRKPRSMDIMRTLAIVVVLPALAVTVPITYAQLQTSVAITGNQIGVQGGNAATFCPPGYSVAITNTGPRSHNSARIRSRCRITTTTNTNVNVKNQNSQSGQNNTNTTNTSVPAPKSETKKTDTTTETVVEKEGAAVAEKPEPNQP